MATSISFLDPLQRQGEINELVATIRAQLACQDLQLAKANKNTTISQLLAIGNRSFTIFNRVNIDDLNTQVILEKVIRTVTSYKGSIIIEQAQKACKEVQGLRSLKEHTRPKIIRVLSQRIAKYMLECLSITQKEAIRSQVIIAFILLAL